MNYIGRFSIVKRMTHELSTHLGIPCHRYTRECHYVHFAKFGKLLYGEKGSQGGHGGRWSRPFDSDPRSHVILHTYRLQGSLNTPRHANGSYTAYLDGSVVDAAAAGYTGFMLVMCRRDDDLKPPLSNCHVAALYFWNRTMYYVDPNGPDGPGAQELNLLRRTAEYLGVAWGGVPDMPNINFLDTAGCGCCVPALAVMQIAVLALGPRGARRFLKTVSADRERLSLAYWRVHEAVLSGCVAGKLCSMSHLDGLRTLFAPLGLRSACNTCWKPSEEPPVRRYTSTHRCHPRSAAGSSA